MPRNGSGSYSLSQTSFTTGTVISSSAMNSDLNDIASALTASLCTDGQSTMTGTTKGFAGSAAAPGYAFSGDATTGIYSVSAGVLGFSSSGSLKGTFTSSGFANSAQLALQTPVGAIMDYGGTAAPSGWLFCNNQAVSRATYAALFAIIGTTYGAGDASTTFNVPDCRGRVLAGNDSMGGSAASRIGTVSTDSGTITGTTNGSGGGSSTHVQATAEIGTHQHNAFIGDDGHTHSYSGGASTSVGNNGGSSAITASPGTGQTTGSNTTGVKVRSTAGNAATADSKVSNTGSSTAMAWLQPTIITYKMIYAGV